MAERESFGSALRSLREAQGWTLREICARLDLSIAYVSDLERSRRNPPAPERMLEIAALFDDPDRALERMLAGTLDGGGTLEFGSASPAVRRLLVRLALRLYRTGLDDDEADLLEQILGHRDEDRTPDLTREVDALRQAIAGLP